MRGCHFDELSTPRDTKITEPMRFEARRFHEAAFLSISPRYALIFLDERIDDIYAKSG